MFKLTHKILQEANNQAEIEEIQVNEWLLFNAN